MHTSKLAMPVVAALCCLLMSQTARAQEAYGYASITFDDSSNTVTGYASTDVDYDTAYYYDAEVQAQIEDENGNVLASGRAYGNPSAFTVLDVFQAALCIRFSIISYVIVRPRFLGCSGGRFDYFGFSDYSWGSYWYYGSFFGSRRNRCIFNRVVFIATVISDVIRCLPANVQCGVSSLQILPRGVENQTQFIARLDPNTTGKNNLTLTCRATNPVTGQPQSDVTIRFGFPANPVFNDAGHQNHLPGVPRPLGTFTPTQAKTNNNGEVSSVYAASEFAGGITIEASNPDTGGRVSFEIRVGVFGLEELLGPTGNDGYILTGTPDTYHPGNHFGTPAANASLRQIGIDYRNRFFPESDYPDGVPVGSVLKFNDQSLAFGGKFDIKKPPQVPNWSVDSSSHREHRVGINCDISDRTVPNDRVMDDGELKDRWEVVEAIFFRNGSSRTNREHCLHHWHVRFEYGTDYEPTDTCRRSANPNLSTPANGVTAALPGRVEVERFDENNNVAGAFAPDNGSSGAGDIVYSYPEVEPIPGGGGNYVPTSGGQWMNYTVNVASSGSYRFEARVASPYGGNTFHVEVDGVNVTGSVYIPNTGSFDAYQFVNHDDIWIEAGRHVVTLEIEGAGEGKGNFDYFTFAPYTPPQVCDPPYWEVSSCNQGGGYWDYGSCQCNYGYYNY